jgi:hydroxyethylthiazole kinase-like sugar kinase family protein
MNILTKKMNEKTLSRRRPFVLNVSNQVMMDGDANQLRRAGIG